MTNNKRSGGRNIGLKVYAAITSILLAAAVTVTAVGFGTGWWKIVPKDEQEQVQPDDQTPDETPDDEGGAVIGEGEANGISLMSARIAPEDFEAYGVSPLAETAYTITVTPDPVDAMDTYTWKCSNTSQITLSPSSDTKSCTVSCTGAFGTQATITIASAVNPDITATVTVDYVKRIESVNVSLSPNSVKLSNSETSYTVNATPVYGTGTITPDFSVTGGKIVHNLDGLTTQVGMAKQGYRKAIERDFSFSGNTFRLTTPYATFVSGSTVIAGTVATHAPSESSLISAYNNSFTTAATSSANDGKLTVNYKYSYTPEGDDVEGGLDQVTGSASINIEFDVSGMVVNATQFTPSNSAVVF